MSGPGANYGRRHSELLADRSAEPAGLTGVVSEAQAPWVGGKPAPDVRRRDGGPLLGRFVLSAQDAARNTGLGDVAAKSGTPVPIDPITVLLQGEGAADDPWVAEVPFGRAEARAPRAACQPLHPRRDRRSVARAPGRPRRDGEHPPYFYADRPESASFEASLAAIARTAKRMRADGISLRLVPIIRAQLQGLAHRAPAGSPRPIRLLRHRCDELGRHLVYKSLSDRRTAALERAKLRRVRFHER